MATDRPGSGDEHRDDHTDRPREQPPPPLPGGDQQRAGGDGRARDHQAGQARDNWESRRTGQPTQSTSRQDSGSQDSRPSSQDSRIQAPDTRSASQDTRPQAQGTRPSPQDRRDDQPSTTQHQDRSTQQPERSAQQPERSAQQQPDRSSQQPDRAEQQPDTRSRAQMDAENLRGTQPGETSPSERDSRAGSEPRTAPPQRPAPIKSNRSPRNSHRPVTRTRHLPATTKTRQPIPPRPPPTVNL